ncbi:prolyl oligopeptidase family serine peptidase [Gemmatimonadota bacterium Y43]|uniref:prolyl oligopeptidase family serine peptidase n=1 Tax=Gaopeijia maritima TaxID=3119007 RepID=UPI00326C082A
MIRSLLRPALATLLVAIFAAPGAAQVATFEPAPARDDAFELSIRNIMRGPEHVGEPPAGLSWTDDGEWLYFRWRPGGGEWDDARELWRVSADGGAPERVTDALDEETAIARAGGDLTDDGRWKAVGMGGDLYLVDRRDGTVRRLTETRAGEVSPQFTDDETAIIYREGDNLFRMNLADGGIRQITDIRSGSPPREGGEETAQRQFLIDQQEELFEHIRREAEARREAQARRDSIAATEPQPFYVPNGERLGGLSPSPDGSFVVVSTARSAQGTQGTMVPDWVTASGYTEPLNVRTKVGDAQGSSRLALLEPGTGETTWLEIAPEGTESPADGFAGGWNDAGTHAIIWSRTEDNKEWFLYTLEAATGELTLVDQLRDEAWVGGPCGFGCRGWLPGTNTVWYASEESGYAHLYAVEADGTGRRALTSGEWEVLGAEIPHGDDRFLVTTNEGSPFNQHVGWLDFDGGPIEYLTEGDGSWEATLSPDGERIGWVHSVANRPPELYLGDAEPGAEVERITESPTAEWLSYDWTLPEIVRFTAEDGAQVPARIYRPADAGAEANGAAVIFVHGAGYLHNVHNYWSTYYREYMFHHLLAAQGYTVLDIDYRGSAGYGRDWRTGIYQWMGGKDLSDQVDGASWLVANEGIDPARIGIYGGSYGGFITLMALFTADDTFKAGAALRSVTDWAHYNHGYTSNILNQPQDDEEAYRRSSPIYFAEGFGPDQHLLIPHGMVDTNVHFSDVVRLAQRLIELGKENWEMAVYPVENHGFVEPSSWTDEYRRIFELFERTISAPGCTADGGFCAVPSR